MNRTDISEIWRYILQQRGLAILDCCRHSGRGSGYDLTVEVQDQKQLLWTDFTGVSWWIIVTEMKSDSRYNLMG